MHEAECSQATSGSRDGSSSCSDEKDDCRRKAKQCRPKCNTGCLENKARSKCKDYFRCKDKPSSRWEDYAKGVCKKN